MATLLTMSSLTPSSALLCSQACRPILHRPPTWITLLDAPSTPKRIASLPAMFIVSPVLANHGHSQAVAMSWPSLSRHGRSTMHHRPLLMDRTTSSAASSSHDSSLEQPRQQTATI
ncbi:hypothetical protein K504DRAFT_537677, partial [Pleomassaria siparia CBS 279.74]